MKSEKKLSFLVMLVFLLTIGGVLFLAGQKVLNYTSKTEFCVQCHSMEIPQQEWEGSRHFSNTSGIRAECADCHLPVGSFDYLVAKVMALKDIYGEITNKIPDADAYEEHRLTMAQNVWDRMKANDSANCRSCHDQQAWILSEQSAEAQKMHELAIDTKQTCIDCHKGLVHFPPEIVHDSAAVNASLDQYAGQFSAQDSQLFALKMHDFMLNQNAGRLMAFAALHNWKQEGELIQATLAGWQQQGAESIVYLAPRQRIILALLEDETKEQLTVLKEIDDEITGSRWRQVELALTVPVIAVTSNLDALNNYGNGLNQIYCSNCHAPIDASHYTANQWVGIIRSMRDRTPINESEVRVLTLYLQYNAKDMTNNH